MTPAQTFNQDQYARWNGFDGEYWVRQQARLDRTLEPVLAPLVEFAAPKPNETVLDIGCGCGATTIEFACRAARVIGIDISEPMLALAAERLRPFPNAGLRHGDAAALPLSDIAADLIVSRFGVMFFGDPVAAFTNLRTALVPGGRLRFACWRSISENPWLQIPLHAAYEHVPRLPKPDPEEPGPFAFADTERVTRILTAAGFSTPSFTKLDIRMHVGSDLESAVRQSTEMGPAKRALADQPEDLRNAAIESIRRALASYVTPAGVTLSGAVWLVGAETR
ncbi:MAG TPA: class I SAM-dependent methyltransferase [Bryobacteraceae bacterium]|nr:class I SAM-dependent methyltransferase [Bryobacteraceae bacterium]